MPDFCNTYNKGILKNSRLELGFTLQSAAELAHIDSLTRGQDVSAADRLNSWEEGSSYPTYIQLEKLAKAYRIPVLTFFMSNPPEKSVRLKDYRTLSDRIKSNIPEFHALVQQIEALQMELYDILSSDNIKLDFVGSLSNRPTTEQLAEILHNFLEYDFSDQIREKNIESAFNTLRNKCGDKGIFVLLQGDLGSFHSKIDINVFRGITFSDQIAPIIVVNSNDTKSARVFTLIHELVHLFLGESVVSNWNSLDYNIQHSINEIELYCDQVAADFLVPKNILLDYWNNLTELLVNDKIDKLSGIFKVSPLIIARRLTHPEIDKISNEYYWNYYGEFMHNYYIYLKQKKDEKPDVHIPNKNRITNKLGKKLIDTISKACNSGELSVLDTLRITNIRVKDFTEMMT
ncbi:hypothetical protein DA01_06560 [Dehalococcoides mccartyi]|uniref:HTH cro/C1-type domain-containing protein n=1 Tax=Dehalococcoides mccartyi TaxID=61435 RepID=A0A0V8LY92_9CHLR|nr:XRE family transcriptional regulator [Dehalococcoides mccartyi]KSV16329.1 hypothetical protein DA01_06560 [Dehalococcoides mccartyi]